MRSGLTDAEYNAFQKLARDRNQMVHFFHPAENDERLKGNIVKTQLSAWYVLHRLLKERWKEVFSVWSEEIEAIDVKLRKYREFLQIIFDNIKDEIRVREKKGAIFRVCPSCHFLSQEHSNEFSSIYESKCLVCSLVERNLDLECTSCGTTVYFANEGFARCEQCEANYEPKDLIAELQDNQKAQMARSDGDDSWGLSNCGFCDGWQMVVRVDEDEYVCVCCFEESSSVADCEWCNEGNTGDMEDSYLSGCNQCEGWFGRHSDD